MNDRVVPSEATRPADGCSRAGHTLDPVLRPATVVVVGASPDPTKRGHRAVRALRKAGFRGRVIPVHPGGGQLFGLPVVRGPADLDVTPDLALVCTPAATAPRVLEEWADRGAKGAVVLAAGFAESGQEGAALERRVREVAERTGMRIIGPNTSGILNVTLGLDLIGVEGVEAGPISLLVQSGNMALALITEAARARLGFSFVIGVGNEIDVRFDEYLDFLTDDDRTRVILVHAEGFRNGAAFLAAARRAAQRKPVVMIKGARTTIGGAAARSHTGAIAGSYAGLRAGLRQAGVIEVRRTDELLPVAATLVAQPCLGAGRGIAILSDGGGHATIAIDELHERNVPVASLATETRDALRALLGPAAAVVNPVDLAGAADRDPFVFARALELLVRDPAVGVVFVVGLFGGYAIRFAESLLPGEIDAARRLPEIAREAGIALVVHTLYGESDTEPLRVLREREVPVIGSLESACRCVTALVERAAARRTHEPSNASWPASLSADGRRTDAGASAPDHVDAALREGRNLLLEPEARALVESFGTPMVEAQFCMNGTEAEAAAERIGGSVVVRVVSPSAPHKTEAGGVALDVAPREVRDAVVRVQAAVRDWCAGRGEQADVRGVLVSPMLPQPIAELLIGIVRDAQLGPILTVGAGGTDVELQRDVALRVLPIEPPEVREMLAELRIASVLAGHRGRPAADAGAIERAVLALSHCAVAYPEIIEMEVNPLFVYEDRAVGLDVRVFVERR